LNKKEQEMAECVKRVVKKSDLKNGMLVDVVDPDNLTSTYTVLLDGVAGDMLISQDGWLKLNNYNEDLQSESDCYKIVAVYFPKQNWGWTWNTKNEMWWKREEVTAPVKPVELTLKEIEEELGYSIKIKEETKFEESKSDKGKYKIIDIGRNDAFYNRREQLIGQFVYSDDVDSWENGWKFGHFTFKRPVRVGDKILDYTCFHQVKLEEIE
jgi:hypothetical protein